jgi:hypothetical protein
MAQPERLTAAPHVQPTAASEDVRAREVHVFGSAVNSTGRVSNDEQHIVICHVGKLLPQPSLHHERLPAL